MRTVKDNEKETYRLWYEYLKQSEDYRLFCKHAPFNITDDDPNADLEARNLSCGKTPVTWSELHDMYISNFMIFGNIVEPENTFETWWESLKKKQKNKQWKDVEIISEQYLVECFDKILNNFKYYCLSKETQPVLVDKLRYTMKDILDQILRFNHLILGINIYLPLGHLQKSFMQVIKDVKKRKGIDTVAEQKWMNRQFPTPVTLRLSNELGKYLEVYKLRKNGFKWKDIIQRLSPAYINGEDKIDENGRRLFQGYLKKAERIIRNVEQGIFPGKY